jgi:hypothetical protein
MLNMLKKNSVKYLVFAINVLLAAIAVLIIREKDQARLISKAQKESVGNESEAGSQLPSFKSSVNVEESLDTIPVQVPPVDSQADVPVEPVPQSIAPATPTPKKTAPALTPAPVPKAKPANAQTKTS